MQERQRNLYRPNYKELNYLICKCPKGQKIKFDNETLKIRARELSSKTFELAAPLALEKLFRHFQEGTSPGLQQEKWILGKLFKKRGARLFAREVMPSALLQVLKNRCDRRLSELL